MISKKRNLISLLCVMLLLLFTACSQKEKQEDEGLNVIEVEEESGDEQQEENPRFTTTIDEESKTDETDIQKEEKKLPNEEVVTEMLNAIIDWSGIQFFYDCPDVISLTAEQAVPMIAHAAGYYGKTAVSNHEGYVLITKDVYEDLMLDYYGKKFDVLEVTDTTENRIIIDENTDIHLQLGDWGLSVPIFEITDISFADDQSGDAIVTAEYYIDDKEHEIVKPAGYTATYRMQQNKNSKYGFVITDMQTKNVPSEETIYWADAYIDYLQNQCNTEYNQGYQLIYIDEDNIPELVEIGDCEATGCRIDTFSNGKVFTTQLNRLYFTYIEGENLLCNSEGLMDCYYDFVYGIVDGKLTKIAAGYYGAEDNTNIQFDENGNPIYKWEWEGKEVTSEEYSARLNKIYDTSKAIPGYRWNEYYDLQGIINTLNSY